MSAPQPAPGPEEETPRLLIVDDEKGPRESLRIILSDHYDVETAKSGGEALARLRERAFDLVTIDLNMPGMKGQELIRNVREEFADIAVVVITGCGTLESAVEGIRCGVSDYLSKPFDVVQVTGAVSRAISQKRSRQRLVRFLETVGSVLGRDRDASQALDDLEADQILQRRLRRLLGEPALDPASSSRARLAEQGTVEFLEVLAETIESRDVFMRGHARRVAFYATLLCDHLDLPLEEKEHVRISSFLHDLGKVGVPSHVLASPEELDPDGARAMHAHAAIGERLVAPLGFSAAVRSAIRHHHERWDGTGYADALRGEEIPLSSRIIAICDAFDAMTCDRPYRERMDRDEAIDELRKHAGSQFDPTLVEQFIAVIEAGSFDLASEQEGGAEPTWIGDAR